MYMTYMLFYRSYLNLFMRIILSKKKENVVILDKYNSSPEVEWVRKNISYFYETLDVEQPKGM